MIRLEQLADGSVSDRNFQKLMSLVPDTGGQSVGIRFGTTTVSWPGGSAFANNTTVTHGLGKTPLVVVATANVSTVAVLLYTLTPGATTFVITGWSPSGVIAVGNPQTVSWVAIG